MFDTHAIARTLTDAGVDPAHADAITDAIRQAAEHQPGDPANRAEMYRAMLIQTAATIGGTVALLRLLG